MNRGEHRILKRRAKLLEFKFHMDVQEKIGAEQWDDNINYRKTGRKYMGESFPFFYR